MASRIFRTRLTFRCAGDAAMIVQHWVGDFDPADDDFSIAADLAAQMIASASPTEYLPRLMACMSEDCFASSLEVAQIWPTGGNAYNHQWQTTDEPGQIVDSIQTSEIAGCLIFMSNVEPSKVGRNFIPGVPKSFVDGGRWTSPAVTVYENFANRCVAGFTSGFGNYDLVIWRESDSTFRLVSDGYLSPNVAQQSRRGVMP